MESEIIQHAQEKKITKRKSAAAALSRYAYIACLCPVASGGRVLIKLARLTELDDIINCSKFHYSRSKGFRFLGSENRCVFVGNRNRQ